MTHAERLAETVAKCVDEVSRSDLLGFEPTSSADHGALHGSGLIGVLPLWKKGDIRAGLIARPETDPLDWVAVIEGRGQALTLASNARTALPRFLLTQVLADNAKLLEALAAEWSDVRARLAKLHGALGGTAASFDPLEAAIADADVRNALSDVSANPDRFQGALSALSRAVDSSAAFAAFADWLDTAVAGDPTVRQDTQAMGPWARLCVAWAQKLLERSRGKAALPPAVVMDLIVSFAGVDACVPAKASWTMRSVAGSGEAGQVSLARDFDEDSTADRVELGLVEALRTERLRYNGVPHAEAVVVFDEQGEPARAWGALNSAAWWMARRMGEAPPAILDGARLLCDRHGWEDIRWVVERNAEGAS